MRALDRKLLRDLRELRGMVLAIALVQIMDGRISSVVHNEQRLPARELVW
jgi:hypothetical protein